MVVGVESCLSTWKKEQKVESRYLAEVMRGVERRDRSRAGNYYDKRRSSLAHQQNSGSTLKEMTAVYVSIIGALAMPAARPEVHRKSLL